MQTRFRYTALGVLLFLFIPIMGVLAREIAPQTRTAPLDAMAEVDLSQVAQSSDETLFANIPETWVFGGTSSFNLATSQATLDKLTSTDTTFEADGIILQVYSNEVFGFFDMTIEEVIEVLQQSTGGSPFIPYDNLESTVYFSEGESPSGLPDIEIFTLMFQNPDGTSGMIVGMVGGEYADHEATILAILQTIRKTPIQTRQAPLDAIAQVELPQVAHNEDETFFMNIPETWAVGDFPDLTLATSQATLDKLNTSDTTLGTDELLMQVYPNEVFSFWDMTIEEVIAELQQQTTSAIPYMLYHNLEGAVYYSSDNFYVSITTVQTFNLIFQNPDGTTGMIVGITGGEYADYEAIILAILQTIRTSR